MSLSELTAVALPEGNRVELTWKPDIDAEFDEVLVVRRTVAYPEGPQPRTPSQGVVIADSREPGEVKQQPDGRMAVQDGGLSDGTVYYYQVFPYRLTNGKPHYDDDPGIKVRTRVSVAATGKHGFAERMYGLLPEIYRRYDTDHQLRKFLDVIGGELDQMYSAVRSLPDLKDISAVDGRLLPLLAEWIGWRTDYSADFDRQRADLCGASRLYQANQTVAAVQAGVRRVTGWDNVCKEFVDNVAITNSPERHNLWMVTPPGEPGDQPLSFDEMFASRAAVAAIGDRVVMVHATNRSGPFEICQKERVDGAWQPSTVVVSREGIEREPALVWRGEDKKLWLFWATLSSDTGWGIEFRSRPDSGTWSAISQFTSPELPPAQRRSPALLVDDDGGLWVFWRELVADRWALRYQRFTGATLNPTPDDAKTFPMDGQPEPRVESDLSVLLCKPQGGVGSSRILVVWARRDAQRCWRVAARVKRGTDVANVGDWSAITEVPGETRAHDREPSAYCAGDGKLTVYFSSTRDGSWSVWNVEVDPANPSFGTAAPTTTAPFSDRAPIAFDVDGEVAVVYRSSRPAAYRNLQYAATVAEDIRYCGNTTLRTGNAEQVKRMGTAEDFTAYTYDAGRRHRRNDGDLVARDTLGIYIISTGVGEGDLAAGRRRLYEVLGEFLPATTRAVVIPNKDG